MSKLLIDQQVTPVIAQDDAIVTNPRPWQQDASGTTTSGSSSTTTTGGKSQSHSNNNNSTKSTSNVSNANVVEQAWDCHVLGNPISIISQKLKALKYSLKTLSKQHFTDLSGKVEDARISLHSIQLQLQPSPHNAVIIQLEKKARKDYCELLDIEHEDIRQRADFNERRRCAMDVLESKSSYMEFASRMSKIGYVHVYRETNRAADYLATLEIVDGYNYCVPPLDAQLLKNVKEDKT
ncbi:hypothetical protein IFM89_014325 [Coptis chinensis]|uniref:Uncharacterized protein n=1 Tax=Coptis chinensis TaxID=261450 RepID=A0A835LUB4_9MAGN|nr:hypothetical protein IFM89_014325 [Coptis chinensis]